jgi:hypothetical protein
VSDIKDILDESEEEEEDWGSTNTTESGSNQAFLFGLSSTTVQMAILHPPPAHVASYWQVFKENIDPIIKIFHAPTREKTVLESAAHLTSLSRPTECIMFSIYYSAVISLPDSECLAKFGESKTDLLMRYKFGMEQALARADFVRTDSIFVLQSYTLFLVCLRRLEDARYIWSMSALALRIGQALGIHRDGSHYPNLTPFVQEMRRRLWWILCQFDTRASEDLGGDMIMLDMISDAKLPRNLNDEDLYMEMTALPESRKGGTDMTLPLIRNEISVTLQKISYSSAHLRPRFRAHGRHKHSLEDKKLMIQTLKDRFETEYFKDIDQSNLIFWLAVTVARLVISKMHLVSDRCLNLPDQF